MLMTNEGSTKPTYSELYAENLRVRGLLQQAIDRMNAASHDILVRPVEDHEVVAIALKLGEPLTEGAESADIGKLDAVDKRIACCHSAPVRGCKVCMRNYPDLVSAGTQVNRVDEAPSGSAAYHQEHMEMQRRIKNQRQQLAKAYKDLEEKNRRIEYLEPFRQQVQGIAGSAETGGEKAGNG